MLSDFESDYNQHLVLTLSESESLTILLRAEPHSERENVTGKAAGSTTSEVQKTHSNLAPRVGGERERKKNGEKNPEQADKVQGGILREEKKQRQRTRFFSKQAIPELFP